VTSSLSKSSVFKTFSVHTKTQGESFQIPLVWEKLRFGEVSVDGKCNHQSRSNAASLKFSGDV